MREYRYQMISTKHQIIQIPHSLQIFILSIQASTHVPSCFGNSSAACARFLLSMKRRVDVMLDCLSILSFYLLPKSIKFLFWKCSVTHDIINSNLVLIVLTFVGFQCKHSECSKIVRWSTKISVASQLLKSIKSCLA